MYRLLAGGITFRIESRSFASLGQAKRFGKRNSAEVDELSFPWLLCAFRSLHPVNHVLDLLHLDFDVLSDPDLHENQFIFPLLRFLSLRFSLFFWTFPLRPRTIYVRIGIHFIYSPYPLPHSAASSNLCRCLSLYAAWWTRPKAVWTLSWINLALRQR